MRIRLFFCLAVISVLFTCKAFSEEINVQWQEPSPMKMQATFEHKDGANVIYTSHIGGPLFLNIRPGLNNSLEAQVLAGIGKHNRGLSIHFKPSVGEETNAATGAVPCILAGPDFTEEALNKWMRLKTEANPALKIPLIPMLSDVQNVEISSEVPLFPVYANPQPVTGKVFIRDPKSEKPLYVPFAMITIPAFKLQMNMVPGNNGQEPHVQISNAEMTNTIKKTWKALLKDGNSHLGLPQKPVPGSGEGIEALSYMPKGGKDQLYSLYASMESLFIAGIMTRQQTANLLGTVGGLAKFKKQVDGEGYIGSLLSFEQAVGDMSNTLPAMAFEHLSAKSDIAMRGFLDGGMPDAPPYTPSDPVDRTAWFVDADSASSSPDGTLADPYPSIADALAAAEFAGLVGLNLHVFGGVYREPLNITRDTALIEMPGETAVISGPITNMTPARLDIRDFHLIGADGLGAVNVNNDDAVTVLSSLIIEGAERHGVFQRGGELRLTDVHVDRTEAVPGVYWCGAGIVVTGGCSAIFMNVTSENNESNGFVIDGTDTYFWGRYLAANHNETNHLWEEELVLNQGTLVTSGVGGFVVQHGAIATIAHMTIAFNELEGLTVHQGAAADIDDLFLYGSYEFHPDMTPWPDGEEFNGGLGLRVRTGGILDISDFIIANNDLVGIVLSTVGELDLHNGSIAGNPVGVRVCMPDYDLLRLMDNVMWDNRRNLDMDSMPVPDADLP